MEIILLNDVAKVGQKFQLVRVSEGYAVNFLIPRGLAKAATPAALKELEVRKSAAEQGAAAGREKLASDLAKIDGKTLTMRAKANEQGELFAAVHADKIATALYDQLGACVPADAIALPEPIKHIGEHQLRIASEAGEANVTLSLEAEK